jgi:hypothetical protein
VKNKLMIMCTQCRVYNWLLIKTKGYNL